jgi:hypothetical protein
MHSRSMGRENLESNFKKENSTVTVKKSTQNYITFLKKKRSPCFLDASFI